MHRIDKWKPTHNLILEAYERLANGNPGKFVYGIDEQVLELKNFNSQNETLPRKKWFLRQNEIDKLNETDFEPDIACYENTDQTSSRKLIWKLKSLSERDVIYFAEILEIA